MTRRTAWPLALVLICGTARAADDAAIKKAAKAGAEACNAALLKGDYAKVADLTHPKLIAMVGGREKMIDGMRKGTEEMKSKGFSLLSVAIDEPDDPVASADAVYLVIPFRMTMKVPNGKLRQKAYLIGVSGDEGRSWTFINGVSDLDKLRQILPDLPKALKLPAPQKPELEPE